jgi:hypothetical protein
MDVWLEKEGVDLVCVTDASRDEMVRRELPSPPLSPCLSFPSSFQECGARNGQSMSKTGFGVIFGRK